MDQFKEKEIIQAVVIADNNISEFRPISTDMSTALIPLVNVPVLDYALEALNRSGIEEVFVYSSLFISNVKEHIKKRIVSNCSWSINMSVKVIGSEGSRCLGDAIRDLDAKGLIRGHFILMEAGTVTNANLATILEEHKKTAKFDKGTAMTIVAKKGAPICRTGDDLMIAIDPETRRLHFHQRLKQTEKETQFRIPMDIFLNNSKISLLHNIIDPQIAIGSPTLLSLFSDNFDFESRDDFIRGLLINEEILDSRIYVSLLPEEQYGRKISNWLSYQIVSQDILNRWTYPLVPDMGICCLKQNYLYLRNNIYKSPLANITRAVLKENIVIQEKSLIGMGSHLSSVVIGRNCVVGKNCILKNAFLFDGVTVEDGCNIQYSVIGAGSSIGQNSDLSEGVVLGAKVILPPNTKISKILIQNNSEDGEITEKLGDAAFVLDDKEEFCLSDSDEEELELTNQLGIPKMMKLPHKFEDSDYNSSTDEEETEIGSPIPDDTNIFLSEVIDSLIRGFEDKSDPNFLILEINSSRYAYNMSLQEVNFYVVKAIFSLPKIKENYGNVLTALHQVLSHLGPVVLNYIKTEDAMIDCLKAVEICCDEELELRTKAAQIIHYLYDKEYVSEEAILAWYNQLGDEADWIRESLKKLIDWLMASSEEDSDEEE